MIDESAPYELIDIGANLAHDSFDEDREEVLERALDAGVTRMIVTGSSDASNRRAAELAHTHPGVLYSTAGVHPHHASDYNEDADNLIRDLVQRDTVVAVGECGPRAERQGYGVRFAPIGTVDEEVGAPTQMGVFTR